MFDRDEHNSVARAVLVPLFQASTTGLLLGLGTAAIFYQMDYERPMATGALVAALCTALTWLTLLRRWLRMGEIEAGITSSEIEPAEVTEQPSVRVELIQDAGRNVQFADLPADTEQLMRLADGLMHGVSFSEGGWTGAGGLFSRSQFRSIRDELIKRGWLSWVNPTARAQGLELTSQGKAVMRHFASMSEHSPTLRKRG